MLNSIKPLLDSELVNEDTRIAIQEEWEEKLNETREEVKSELREEFSRRYEHDKDVMVEAIDRMVTDGLRAEIKELAEDKQALAGDRVKFQKKMAEDVRKFNEFMVTKLAEEIKQLRGDRIRQADGFTKMESFVSKALSREIVEFHEDKRDLVESKVKLIAEAKQKLNKLKANFIKESSNKVKNAVSTRLSSELSQLHEDVKAARENDFGRRIYEAFATEFLTTHLNESAEVKKLKNTIAARDNKLAEAKGVINKAKVLIESKDRKVRMITESNQRSQIMDELLGPLNEEKADIMNNLLESVQTSRLQGAFEKYLPAVLNGTSNSSKPKKKKLTESREETGNKRINSQSENVVELDNIRKLAGLDS